MATFPTYVHKKSTTGSYFDVYLMRLLTPNPLIMKKLLPFLFTIAGFSSTAQIVNIPDANFKTALLYHWPLIDLNHDGQIQVTEASAATQLNVPSKNIANMTGL